MKKPDVIGVADIFPIFIRAFQVDTDISSFLDY
jgi:hypothetical protein